MRRAGPSVNFLEINNLHHKEKFQNFLYVCAKHINLIYIFAMRKKLISALATKFAGVEAKVLGRIADNLMHDKTIESDEDVNSAVEEVTFADILKSYGDSRAAEASKTAVSNYEKKHGLKDGKPTAQNDDDDDDEPDDDDDDEPDNNGTDKNRRDGKQKSNKSNANSTNNKQVSPEVAQIMKLMKAMSEKLDSTTAEISNLKKGKVTETRKARLAEVLKGLKETQKKAYTRLPLDDYSDEDFESLIDEITDEVDELTKENDADGGSFGAPLGGSGERGGSGSKTKEATEAEISSIVDSFNL